MTVVKKAAALGAIAAMSALLGWYGAAVTGHAAGRALAAMTPSEKRELLLIAMHEVRDHAMHEGHYACCLEKPCASCLSLSPWHGEDETCACLEDVMNGRAPCGECVGGILAGRGNPFLAKHFARALAGEHGEMDAMRRIVAERYGVAPEDQY